MNFAQPYKDLREFIAALDEKEKLYRIHREINKDTELQPLVRWQFRGLPEEARRGFLFDNVTDGKKHKYNCRVLVGGLSGSEAIYSMGLKCSPEEVPDRWIYALDHLIAPVMVDRGPAQEEVHMGANLLEHGGINEFAIPVSTPGFDNGPYITAGHWISKDPETGQRNVGNYRGLIKGPDRSGLMTGTPQDSVQSMGEMPAQEAYRWKSPSSSARCRRFPMRRHRKCRRMWTNSRSPADSWARPWR